MPSRYVGEKAREIKKWEKRCRGEKDMDALSRATVEPLECWCKTRPLTLLAKKASGLIFTTVPPASEPAQAPKKKGSQRMRKKEDGEKRPCV